MKLLKYLPIALVAVLLCLAGWSLLTYEDNQLWKLQELNLFMDTSLFFKQQLVVPGGLLTYLGTYFTQYFFYAWQGVLIVCAWWMLLVWLSAKALKVPMKWCLLMAVPERDAGELLRQLRDEVPAAVPVGYVTEPGENSIIIEA